MGRRGRPLPDDASAARDAVGHHADNLRAVLSRLGRSTDVLTREECGRIAGQAVDTLRALAQAGHDALDEAQARQDRLDGATTLSRRPRPPAP